MTDLVSLDRVRSYPTNFAAMSKGDLGALAGRDEGLIDSLLPYYCPELLDAPQAPKRRPCT